MIKRLLWLSASLITLLPLGHARAETITVAVASNFTAPAEELAQAFEESTGHNVRLTFGSSGKLLAQITHGAPFDAFLSADQSKPQRLTDDNLAVEGTQFTYALGTLALWTAADESAEDRLRQGRYNHLALASPRLAPYGAAAMQVLENMGLIRASRPRLVMGESITQTWQFVSTGNADIGFVALSQIMKDGIIKSGNAWMIPSDLYDPVRQDAVLLNRAEFNATAQEWLRFLQSDSAHLILRRYGYGLP